MSFLVTVAVGAGVGGYSGYQQAKKTNEQATRTQKNAKRRYALKSSVAVNQMEEQVLLASQGMTEASRNYLLQFGSAKSIQAESGVSGGVSSERIKRVMASKLSEQKSNIAQGTETNVINIANQILAEKIDTDALVADAEASRQNPFEAMLIGGLQGATSGASLGNSLGGGSSASGNNANNSYKPTTSANYGTSSGQWAGV